MAKESSHQIRTVKGSGGNTLMEGEPFEQGRLLCSKAEREDLGDRDYVHLLLKRNIPGKFKGPEKQCKLS